MKDFLRDVSVVCLAGCVVRPSVVMSLTVGFSTLAVCKLFRCCGSDSAEQLQSLMELWEHSQAGKSSLHEYRQPGGASVWCVIDSNYRLRQCWSHCLPPAEVLL